MALAFTRINHTYMAIEHLLPISTFHTREYVRSATLHPTHLALGVQGIHHPTGVLKPIHKRK